MIYLTPIHPVGRTNRKGKNNSLNTGRQIQAASMQSATRAAVTMRLSPSLER